MNQFISASSIFGHVLILICFVFTGCFNKKTAPASQKSAINTIKEYTQKNLLLPTGEKLHTFIAQSAQQHTQGLSGIKNTEFKDNQAMFFQGRVDQTKMFWMPDTYFDLDIFFLDKDMRVIEVERNLPHHPGRKESPPIARTKKVYCRHVLEIKSSSPLAKKIHYGQQLKWDTN